eukprot:9005633-Lingulodinium_polyedra.AAC.1
MDKQTLRLLLKGDSRVDEKLFAFFACADPERPVCRNITNGELLDEICVRIRAVNLEVTKLTIEGNDIIWHECGVFMLFSKGGLQGIQHRFSGHEVPQTHKL